MNKLVTSRTNTHPFQPLPSPPLPSPQASSLNFSISFIDFFLQPRLLLGIENRCVPLWVSLTFSLDALDDEEVEAGWVFCDWCFVIGAGSVDGVL